MDELFERIWAKKLVFLGTFFIVLTLTYIVLVALDFFPEPKSATGEENPEQMQSIIASSTVVESEQSSIVNEEEEATTVSRIYDEVRPLSGSLNDGVGIFPLSISIPKLQKTIAVQNPTSRVIAELDAALLKGVVRHPDSATLSQEGNVFILGHSSYLPNVLNRNFQAFNGIQNLAWGDVIELYSDNMVYVYRVEKVYRARAQDVTVPIAGTGSMLTLATCNSFGSVDDRYIVEAKQIEVKYQ